MEQVNGLKLNSSRMLYLIGLKELICMVVEKPPLNVIIYILFHSKTFNAVLLENKFASSKKILISSTSLYSSIIALASIDRSFWLYQVRLFTSTTRLNYAKVENPVQLLRELRSLRFYVGRQ